MCGKGNTAKRKRGERKKPRTNQLVCAKKETGKKKGVNPKKKARSFLPLEHEQTTGSKSQ